MTTFSLLHILVFSRKPDTIDEGVEDFVRDGAFVVIYIVITISN